MGPYRTRATPGPLVVPTRDKSAQVPAHNCRKDIEEQGQAPGRTLSGGRGHGTDHSGSRCNEAGPRDRAATSRCTVRRASGRWITSGRTRHADQRCDDYLADSPADVRLLLPVVEFVPLEDHARTQLPDQPVPPATASNPGLHWLQCHQSLQRKYRDRHPGRHLHPGRRRPDQLRRPERHCRRAHRLRRGLERHGIDWPDAIVERREQPARHAGPCRRPGPGRWAELPSVAVLRGLGDDHDSGPDHRGPVLSDHPVRK